MNVALLVSQNEPEVIWNAFRFANLMLNELHEVTLFLNGPSVGFRAHDGQQFPLNELARTFVLSEGVLLA